MLKHFVIVSVAVIAALCGARSVMTIAHATNRPEPPIVAKAADGHYWAEAEVNGRPVRFLIDTGASVVTLTAADAARLGFDPETLDFARTVRTGAGEARAAKVLLDHVVVGGARVEQVPAIVLRDGLPTSLLGMSYLGRLSRFEATPEALVLHP
jgi:aspartyl protease family protein